MIKRIKQSYQEFKGVPLIIFIVMFSVDQWSKWLIADYYAPKGEVFFPVIEGFLNIIYVTNKGAILGLFSEYTWVLALISLFAGGYIFIYLKDFVQQDKVYRILSGIFLSGIFGNFVDRAFRKEGVVDMIDVVFGSWHYPTFNVADACIFISVIIYLIYSYFFKRVASVGEEFE